MDTQKEKKKENTDANIELKNMEESQPNPLQEPFTKTILPPPPEPMTEPTPQLTLSSQEPITEPTPQLTLSSQEPMTEPTLPASEPIEEVVFPSSTKKTRRRSRRKNCPKGCIRKTRCRIKKHHRKTTMKPMMSQSDPTVVGGRRRKKNKTKRLHHKK